jgi:hypothetical protein
LPTGAEDIDAVAVLAGAAGAVRDPLDAVVDDHRAVVATFATPDLDAVVAGADDGIARDQETARVERMNRNVGAVDDTRRRDFALDGAADDADAAAVANLAVRDLDCACMVELQQALPLGQAPPLSIERQAGERHVAGIRCRDQGSVVGNLQPGCAAHAEELGAGGQLDAAGAIGAGPDRERLARARGFVDRSL